MNARAQTDLDMPEPSGQEPIYSDNAEQCVLGGLMLDNNAVDLVEGMIGEADFYTGDHRTIWRAIHALIDAGKAADMATVHERLNLVGTPIEDQLKYLHELTINTPGTSNIKGYAEIVRSLSLRRQLVRAGNYIVDVANRPKGRDSAQLVDEAQAKIMAVADVTARESGEFHDLSHYLTDAVGRIQELSERESDDDVIGLPTGFTQLDRKTAGMMPGDLIIMAARPALGNTSLAMNMAEHVALQRRVPVGVFSMEMPGNQLTVRLMASVAGLNQHRVRRGRLNQAEWGRLADSVEKMRGAPLFLDETSMLNPQDLRARARRLYRATKGKLGLIVIDYLQLMSGTNEREPRVNQIGEISRGMKLLAKELGIPVIALSQLNRELEKRTDKRPIMSDLRDGGGIEQDADVILFIYRDEVYHENSADKGMAEIIVSKQRNGPVGRINLAWHQENTRFENPGL